ncbi:HDIG domain-containing protein [bacterium]|nr:HDIG domain-containing protein [bacterium]
MSDINAIFPELKGIKDQILRDRTEKCIIMGIEQGGWTHADLDKIPFTLLIPNCPVSWLQHTLAVTQLSLSAFDLFVKEYSQYYQLNRDYLISGALLHDIGKLLEYKRVEGKYLKSDNGKFLRHPFSGANLAAVCGLPDDVVHIIAVHAHEGDSGYRSPEARIVNHADFMNFEPLRDVLK